MRLVIEGSGDTFGIVFKPVDAATTGRSLVWIKFASKPKRPIWSNWLFYDL